jgi:hypothetical protein
MKYAEEPAESAVRQVHGMMATKTCFNRRVAAERLGKE